MITIKFFETSEVDDYINNTKAEVEDIFQMYYPDSECELKVDKEEAQFEIIFKDNWSSPEDIGEDIIKLGIPSMFGDLTPPSIAQFRKMFARLELVPKL